MGLEDEVREAIYDAFGISEALRQYEPRPGFIDARSAKGVPCITTLDAPRRVCRWCGAPVEECLPAEPGEWVHVETGMSLCWKAPDGESCQPLVVGDEHS